MAKQSKSTQESAKPKKPLVNWFNRTKTKSSVTDSIAPDSSVISYNKKTVTAPASILGGGAMKKNFASYSAESFGKSENGNRHKKIIGYNYSKEKEGQKSKSEKFIRGNADFSPNNYKNENEKSHSIDIENAKFTKESFRKPTKNLSGKKENKDFSYYSENHYGFGKSKNEGVSSYKKEKLALPTSTAKNMKDSFDNMKSAPEYIITKTKKSSSKY